MGALLTLGDHINTQKGYAFKSKWFADAGNPIVKVSDFTADSIDPSSLVKISDELASDYQKYRLETGDVVIQTVGSWPSNPASVVGKTIKVPKTVAGALLNQNAVRIEPVESLHKGFLYYLLRSEHFKEYIIGTAQGAASQASITLEAIKGYKFECPSYEVQTEIAEALATYDNLIENNNRRIAILEDMAQALYREWFVKFRFPGYENAKFKDSPLGQIPVGWEVKTATDVIEFAPKMSLPKDGEKPFVAMPSISTSSMIIGDIEMRAGNSGTKFVNGDTLMARITPCLQNGKIGFVQFLGEENPIGFGSTEFIVMRSKHLTPEFVYCLARSDSFRGNAINSMAGADGRQRVKNDCFKSYYLAVPPDEVLDKFSTLAKPAFKEIFVLSQKNKNLKNQRDMLLPKLISGNIVL